MADDENQNEEENNEEETQEEEQEEENEEDAEQENEEDETDEEDADETDNDDTEDDEENEEKEEDETEDEDDEDADEEMGEPASDEDSSGEAKDVEVPEKFEDIVEEIEGMPVIELNELVSLLEKKWGVSAQAVAAAGGGGGEEEEEEKDAYDVELTDFGDSKISVIKAVKAGLGLGLKEAKGMVEDAPVVLKEGMDADEAEEMKENIEEEGGEVELK